MYYPDMEGCVKERYSGVAYFNFNYYTHNMVKM